MMNLKEAKMLKRLELGEISPGSDKTRVIEVWRLIDGRVAFLPYIRNPNWERTPMLFTMDELQSLSEVKLFKVASGSKPGHFYTITQVDGDARCDCPGFNFRGACRHLKEPETWKEVSL
jgi:hypothetical protein